MKRIPITTARKASEAAGARGVIILAFDETGRYSAVSYGETVRECGELGRVLDSIADGLERGTLRTPVLGGHRG